jgi:RNA polymerase sigma-70 factor (ECF subfamily)
MKEKILEEIMKREGRKLFNMVLRMVRQREEAEELLQEVFTSFYNNLDKINPPARTSYLYKIGYHKTLNRIKKMKRERNLYQTQLEKPVAGSEPDQSLRNEIIKKALSQLNPAEALLIDLQFYQKLSYKQISEITGHSVGSIDSRLVRAKRKLRGILEKMGIKNVQENKYEAVL